MSGWITENVINVGASVDFIKAGTTHVWTPKNASTQEQAQFRHLLWCVTTEVLQQRWLFSNNHHNDVLLRRTKHNQVSLIKTQNPVKCFMKNAARKQIEHAGKGAACGLSSGQEANF